MAAIALIVVLGAGGVFLYQNVTVRKAPDAPDMSVANLLQLQQKAVAETKKAREECEKETQDWRRKDCLDRIPETASILLQARSATPSPSLIRRANDGDPEASLEYGYHLVAKAVVNGTQPLDAIPYLITAALAGDIGAHVQLGLIETVSRQDGDLVKAWAHFDIALREMPQTAPDYRRSQMHLEDIETGLSEADLNRAKALSAEYSETMRTNRNALK